MVWQFLIVFYIDFYSKPRYLTEEPVVYIFKCFTLRPCGLSIPVTMYECLFCATRGLYLLTGLIFEGKDRGLQAQAQRTCAHKRIKQKAAPGETHPPGKPSRPSKRICICGKWQRLLHTPTTMQPHTQCVFLWKQAETLEAKVYITCACKDSIISTHALPHTALPHQYDMSDGNSPKQLSFCVRVEHHMACMPAAWARQRLSPRQLSARHLQVYAQTAVQEWHSPSSKLTDHSA